MPNSQKTIFFTIFQGVEAKNILRSGILDMILKNGGTRVVLFMKSKERIVHYQREFSDPNIFYEAVDPARHKGLDAVLAKLKYTLLKTETTDLRRKFIFEERSNYFYYYSALFLNWLAARAWMRQIVRRLDFALVKNDVYAPYFKKYNPDLVFSAHLFDESEINLLREAKKRGVATIGFINSWDKVTARCMIRLLPDKLIVFNDLIKEEVKRFADMKEQNIFVSGIPQYDIFFKDRPGDAARRRNFFNKIRIDRQNKLIVYAPAGSSCSESDWDIIDLLYDLNMQGKLGKKVSILVRFQPNDFIDEKDIRLRPHLIYDYPGTRFSSKRGVDWDMDSAEIAHLTDTLANMSLLISYASSIVVDAAIFNKPIININFEIKHQPSHKSPTRFHKMAHYKSVLNTGAIKMADSGADLAFWIRRYLAEPSLGAGARKALIRQQCQYTDGKSAERIANFILKNV